MSVAEIIQHYQRSIEKCSGNEERMLYCIGKLYRLPVTVQHLQETGVGRTVNGLRKYVGDVGDAAKALVAKWKTMVADEESSDGEGATDDEANISEPPDDYGNNSHSRKNDKDSSDDRDDNRKESRSGNQQLKEKRGIKPSKNETVRNNLKICSADKSKSKDSYSSKSNSGSGSEKDRHSKTELDKLELIAESKDEKEDRREVKCHSKSDKKSKSDRSSRDHKHDSRRDEKSKSKDKDGSKVTDDLKRDSCKVSSSKSRDVKKSDGNHRKRKLDSYNEKESSKKRKHSESDSEEENEQLATNCEDERKKILKALSSESESEEEISNIQIKVEPPSPPSQKKDNDHRNEEVRSENKSMKEKLESRNVHKSKGSETGERTKRDEEKRKRRSSKLEDKTEHRKSEKRKDDGHHLNRESSKSKINSGVSSSNDKIKDKDKDKEKEKHREKKENKTHSDLKDAKASSNFKEPKEKKKVKKEMNGDEGIDCNSGASFAEALGMCAFPSATSRKRNSSPNLSSSKTIKTEPGTSSTSHNRSPVRITNEVSSSNDNSPPTLLSPNVKLEPLSVDLASTLPEISPNYKPLPYVNPLQRKQEEDRVLNNVIYAKSQRTKVYSGNKSGCNNVPTLYDMCIRILIENIEALEFTGGVPYDIIKPVLERATPDQLFSLEHYNPYLIEDTDTLWQYHCNREFRSKQREEMETWREMYMRCLDEREAKLKALTANIKQSIDKSLPVRQTKLAYVDNVVKPPRNVLRKQAKYGTAKDTTTSTSDLKNKLISGSGAPTNISVPAPPMARSRISSSSVVKKPKAPLMAKALQLIKGRYKR
ncbi:transcription elongation factor B polypeptide 3 [Neodiprion virginianus]|uniref:transcription elongation factor B polypeptide 3 n=1 Tax=Neodiprion virginianus TaxID=2961670 RepID=UPI001EE75559|nr:transcription elongation factor B polypeptide 3 [Neodiprion virginianus]